MNFHQSPNMFVQHVHLKVKDIHRSLSFYEHIIGFKTLSHQGSLATLTADGKNPLLTIEQLKEVEEKTERTAGMYHFALLLPSRADLARILYHLIQTGQQLGAADHHVSEALYLSDPDGNGIEAYVDRPAESWVWNDEKVYMTTEELEADDLLAERHNTKWTGLPTDTIMGHIHLHVADLKQTEEFYTKGLGFKSVNRYGRQALFVSSGNYHHHIGLNTWNGEGVPKPKVNQVGMKYFTLVCPDELKRESTLKQLKEINAYVYKEDGKYFVEDPSGNIIHLKI